MKGFSIFELSFDKDELEEHYNKLMKKVDVLYYDFIGEFKKQPTKIYIGWLAYKKVEVYNFYFSNTIEINPAEATLFGMEIEVVPYSEDILELGFVYNSENYDLGLEYKRRGK